MEEQKKSIIEFVRDQKVKGQSITESLKAVGIKRSTYYAWLHPKLTKQAQSRVKLTPPMNGKPLKKRKNTTRSCAIDRFRGCSRIRASTSPSVPSIITSNQ